MLGNWLSSRAALWVILSCAFGEVYFLHGLSVGEGPGIGQSPENRNRMPSVGGELFFFFFLNQRFPQPLPWFYLFIYLWLHWVFLAACRLLIVVASLVVEHGL